MSGSTIGGVIGAVVGFYFGGPQGAMLGWTVGSGVGAYVDPQKIEGPRLKDATKQTSQDGVPIPFGYGSFPTTGNLIWTDRLVETKSSKRGGKGGPKITEYVYTRSYAVGVCEGEIGGFLIIKRNGKIVYDTRTNDELTALGYTYEQIAESRAAQAKWLAVATLYYGDEAQTPDPTMSAVKGAGNVPSYRGLAYIVCTHEDLTEERGAVPQYDFVVSVCGARTEEAGAEPWRWLGTGHTGAGTRASVRPLSIDMEWVGTDDTEVTATNTTNSLSVTRFGTKMVAVIENNECQVADVTAITTWVAGPTGLDVGTSPLGHTSVIGDRLWVACGDEGLAYLTSPEDTAFTSVTNVLSYLSNVKAVTGNGTNLLCMNPYGAFCKSANNGTAWALAADIFGSGNRFYTSYGALDTHGTRTVVAGGESDLRVAFTDDGGDTFTDSVVTGGAGVIGNQVRHCGGTRWLVACTDADTDANGLFASFDDAETFDPVTLPAVVNFYLQSKQNIAVDGVTGRVVIAGKEIGTDDTKFYYSDDLAGWTEIDMAGTAVVGITEVYPTGSAAPIGTELPDAPGHYVDDDGNVNGPGGTVVERCTPELGIDIVADLCARREVTDIDVSDLTDLVDGFKIATETDPGTAIDATRAAYFYDVSEYDGIVHFPKRGGAVSFALTMDDLAARDGDPIEWERVQEAELLRKVTVGYIDPDTTYTTTTQKWERRTGTVEAKGEASVEIPLVGRKDFAAQVAEKRGKAAWAETEKVRFSLPYKWAKLTTADVGTLTDALGKVHRIRILSIEDDGGYRHIEAAREQTNTYVSTATGTSGPNPTVPGTGLSGPTVAAIMNLPVLRDADDKAGLYIAAAGMLSGWQGALVQLSRDGGTTYENGPIITANATIGELTATLPTATQYTIDNENTLSVSMTPYADSLDSITLDQLLNEGNPCAIMKADGTAEILQFQTATETSPGHYDLTGLVRGALDTTPAEHLAGAKFVLLDDAIRFLPLAPTDLGRSLTIRPVSVGTPPASNASYTITTTSLESLREWQPYNVEIESDGASGYCISWVGRARLGSDAFPQHSQYFAGYSVRLTDGVVIHDIETTEQSVCITAAEMTAIFGGGYGVPTVSVVAKSTSPEQSFNPAAPAGWVALYGTWTEAPAGFYNLLADGASSGRMYREALYPFTSGTFEASVDNYVVGGSALLRVDFINASGITFLTENGNSDGTTSSLTITAASLAPFGTVANARVYLIAVSGLPFPVPVQFYNLSVTVTP